MTIAECYKVFDGNYEETMSRLFSEALLKKLLAKFPADGSLKKLEESLAEKNYEDAFMAAHTLKGVALNMGFTRLADSSSQLTELLRPRVPCDCTALLDTVKANYKEVCDALTLID